MIPSNALFFDGLAMKARLLCDGCRVEPAMPLPPLSLRKRIHLYAHSPHSVVGEVPDDIMLKRQGRALIARVRPNQHSQLSLTAEQDHIYLVDEAHGTRELIGVPQRKLESSESDVSKETRENCSFLGTDVLGVVPSNHCFYFSHGSECRFCEILPTYRDNRLHPAALKSFDILRKVVYFALRSDQDIKHLAFTTGNIQSYDHTFEFYIKLGEHLSLQEIQDAYSIGDILATLMPPDDLGLIARLRDAGFNKVYFPIEVFRQDLFQTMCPGKHAYGYQRILVALERAVSEFGRGNVFTNLIYGLQSLSPDLDAKSYCPDTENSICREASEAFLERGVIPAFTIYHTGGFNEIGTLKLCPEATAAFFEHWGALVHASNIVPPGREAVLFGPTSRSNTLFNDGFNLAQPASH